LRGFGAYIEEDIRESFYPDNANLLRAPGSNVMNIDVHYNPSAEPLRPSTGAENGVTALSTSGVFCSGPPRSFYGGVKIRLFRRFNSSRTGVGTRHEGCRRFHREYCSSLTCSIHSTTLPSSFS
jgi:hypothetical protein